MYSLIKQSTGFLSTIFMVTTVQAAVMSWPAFEELEPGYFQWTELLGSGE